MSILGATTAEVRIDSVAHYKVSILLCLKCVTVYVKRGLL